MPDWKKAIADALRPPTPTGPLNPYEVVVREVTAFINESEPAMRAEVSVQYVGNLQRIDISTYPRRHPSERSIMYLVSITGTGEVLVPTPAGLGHLTDPSPDSLRAKLVEFFTSENFIQTLSHYRQRDQEPVQGWLKRLRQRKTDLADVALLIEPAHQELLVSTWEKSDYTSEISIEAEILTPVANFRPYSDLTDYSTLDSEGIWLDVRGREKKGERLQVFGVLIRPT